MKCPPLEGGIKGGLVIKKTIAKLLQTLRRISKKNSSERQRILLVRGKFGKAEQRV